VPCSGTVPVRRSIPKSLALTVLLGAVACKSDSSNLEKMGEAEKEPAQSTAGKTVTPPPEGDPKDDPKPSGDMPDIPPSALPQDGDGLPIPPLSGAAELITPGAEDKRVELRLALTDDARYRITTIGMLKLPLFDKPVGFAREEDLRVGDCQGEGASRSCLLTHSYRNFEAEPPTGETLEKDEVIVAELETSHRIDTSGLRISETAINGKVENPAQQVLSQVHRFYCVRLPSEPVGVGATWRDVCRTRLGGQIITRELVWKLAKLEETEEGTRAELEFAGRVRRVDHGVGVRSGEVKGALLFWVDAGEPHLLRERVVFTLDAERGLSTGTDLRYQFAKLGKDDELIRTDGKPFDGSPVVLNDPRAVPPGETRDAEHPADGKKRKPKKPQPN
jgi:hypothetical protein